MKLLNWVFLKNPCFPHQLKEGQIYIYLHTWKYGTGCYCSPVEARFLIEIMTVLTCDYSASEGKRAGKALEKQKAHTHTHPPVFVECNSEPSAFIYYHFLVVHLASWGTSRLSPVNVAFEVWRNSYSTGTNNFGQF